MDSQPWDPLDAEPVVWLKPAKSVSTKKFDQVPSPQYESLGLGG